MRHFYHIHTIYKKLNYKDYEWDLPIVELKNEQNVFATLSPAEFLYKSEYSGGGLIHSPTTCFKYLIFEFEYSQYSSQPSVLSSFPNMIKEKIFRWKSI